jgi:hypothetical protein
MTRCYEVQPGCRLPSRDVVAALFVDGLGTYFELPDVELWDLSKDARAYAGPWPVVAHPPCASWSVMGQCRPEVQRQGDQGCFKAALQAVLRFGGVLEHPAYTWAWKAFELDKPKLRGGWSRSLFKPQVWVCHIDQAHYGHRVNKPTWLLYHGKQAPPELKWGKAPRTPLQVATLGGGKTPNLRNRTPKPFARMLVSLAEASR